MHLTLQSRVKQIVLLIISQCGLQVITPLGHLRYQHTNAFERNVSSALAEL